LRGAGTAYSSSELFLPICCRCQQLLLDWIMLNETHTHQHTRTNTHKQTVGLFWTTDPPVEKNSPWHHA